MRAVRRRGSRGTGDLTPLLDTLFILLFALLALSDVRRSREEEVRIELPAVEAGSDEGGPATVVIGIDIGPGGAIGIGERAGPIRTRTELDQELAGALQGRLPEEVVIELRVDRETPHGLAVEVLQHLRLRGFARVRLLATGYAETPQELGGMEPWGGPR